MNRVLVVDDDLAIQRMLHAVLADEGYDVIVAGHGREALSRLASIGRQPDVILLDLMMPVMDGETFLRHFSADDRFHDIPIVLLSASQSAPEIAARWRIAEYLGKPFDVGELLDSVERLIADSSG